jgi:hypothetical protein
MTPRQKEAIDYAIDMLVHAGRLDVANEVLRSFGRPILTKMYEPDVRPIEERSDYTDEQRREHDFEQRCAITTYITE